jgi:integrase
MLIQHTKDGKYLFQTIEGGTIFFRIRRNGRKIVESLQTTNFAEAKIERAKRQVKYSKNPDVQQEFVKVVTVSDLIDDYYQFLEADHAKSLAIMRKVLGRLREHPVYRNRAAASITSDDNWAYRKARLKAGKSEATCNNELSYLRSAFIYGKKQTPPKVLLIPYFPVFRVDNARQGFIEFHDYARIRAKLTASLAPFFVLAYHSGCRSGELQNLQWKQHVDFARRRIVLQPGETKNDEGRVLPFYGDMEECLAKQYAVRQAEFPACPYVFFWHGADSMKTPTQRGGTQRKPGARLKGFRDQWRDAVKEAGYPDLLIHDLRRSSVMNMIQEFGMDEDEAMLISGHKTRFMIQRYNIRKPGKIAKLGAAMEDGFQRLKKEAAGPNAETVPLTESQAPTESSELRS